MHAENAKMYFSDRLCIKYLSVTSMTFSLLCCDGCCTDDIWRILRQAEYAKAMQLDPTGTPLLSNLGALLENTTFVAATATLLPDPLAPGALVTTLKIVNHGAVGGEIRMFWGGTLVLEYEGAPPMSGGGLARAVIPAPRPEFVGPTPEEGELLLTAEDCTFEIEASKMCILFSVVKYLPCS
jgi:hypothetical protein